MLRRTFTLIQYSPLVLSSVKMTVHLTIEQEKKLKDYLKEKTFSWQIKKRLETLRLLHIGISPQLVAKQLAIRQQMIYEYVKSFKDNGFEGLLKMSKPGKETKLTEQMLEELEHFILTKEKRGKKLTREQKAAWLLHTYEIEISPEWLSQRLATRSLAKQEEPWK